MRKFQKYNSRVISGKGSRDYDAEARQSEIDACRFCQENKGQMAPPHFASPNCESGKRNHCTCDACF